MTGTGPVRFRAAVTEFLMPGGRPVVHYDAPGVAPAAGDFPDFLASKES